MALPAPFTLRTGLRYVICIDVQGWMRQRLATVERVKANILSNPQLRDAAGRILIRDLVVQEDAPGPDHVANRFWAWAFYEGPEQVVTDLGDDVSSIQEVAS